MRIVILTAGSRGDVQPYVALGLGLRQAGHQVCLATHTPFRELITGYGLDFAPVEASLEVFTGRQGWQILNESGRNPVRNVRRAIQAFRPIIERLLIDSWHACQGSDAIFFAPLGIAGYHIAEKMGVPCFAVPLYPVSRTRAFPCVLLGNLRLGSSYNLLTHVLVEQIFWQIFRRQFNQWRQEILDLPPLPADALTERLYSPDLPILYGFSPLVVTKPADWPDWLHVTGYWFLEHQAKWQPPASLVDFLAAGPPPVYVGFGSMLNRDPQALTQVAVRALRLAGKRGILLTGWGGLSQTDLPDDIFAIDSIPHDWLFPRMAAVVHHGGAGTTAAGLRAGVPSIVTPFFGDQFFWGRRVYELGTGPDPIPKKRLTAERLAAAIRLATGGARIVARAAEVGQQIRAEDGVARAIEAFQRHYTAQLSPGRLKQAELSLLTSPS